MNLSNPYTQNCLNYNGYLHCIFLLHKVGIVSGALELKGPELIIERTLSSKGQEDSDAKASMADLHPAETLSKGSDDGVGVDAELMEIVGETADDVLELEVVDDDLLVVLCAATDNERDRRDTRVTIFTNYLGFERNFLFGFFLLIGGGSGEVAALRARR